MCIRFVRQVIGTTLLLGASSSLWAQQSASRGLSSANGRTPNIVFILADDLGWQDVGFMGSNYFETPALDALAAESFVFENAFMYSTCSPSRAAILTGQQSFRTGCYTVPVLEKGKGCR